MLFFYYKPKKICVFPIELQQIIGVLKPSDLFFPPYKPFCSECKHLIRTSDGQVNNMLYCTNCSDKKLFSYKHSVQCTIKDADDKLDCILPKDHLQIFFPSLLQISFAEYKQNISATIFMLRALSLKGTFTISMENIFLGIKKI